jgi:hypothetical protein
MGASGPAAEATVMIRSGSEHSVSFRFPAIGRSYRRLLPLIMPGKSSIRPQRWPVKNPQGKVLGYVKSLTVHPVSKRVVSVMLVLRHSGQQLRLPWDRFEMSGEQLLLPSLTDSREISPRQS